MRAPRFKERTDELRLDNLVIAEEVVEVAPDRYAAVRDAPDDPFAAVGDDPFAAVTADPFASLDPFAAVRMDPWRTAAAGVDSGATLISDPFALVPRPRMRRQVVNVFLDYVPKAEGGLYWLPSMEYENAFTDQEMTDRVWPRGALIDFSEAAEGLYFDSLSDKDYDRYLYAVPTASEVDTHDLCTCMACAEVDLDPLLQAALLLRAHLLEDPDGFAESLAVGPRYEIREWAGLAATPSNEDILAALIADPNHGLGGAALDWSVWNEAHEHGPLGERLAEMIEEVGCSAYLRAVPVESFLFHSDDLHRGTVFEEPDWGNRAMYRIHGEYTIAKIDYTSDLTGTVVGGWRSLYMTPWGEGRKPDFQQFDRFKS